MKECATKEMIPIGIGHILCPAVMNFGTMCCLEGGKTCPHQRKGK